MTQSIRGLQIPIDCPELIQINGVYEVELNDDTVELI
jgi:hypothetical protein